MNSDETTSLQMRTQTLQKNLLLQGKQEYLRHVTHGTGSCELVGVTQKTEQKVYSQGRMLGYLFFSLFSSLFASSYVPWGLPPGKDCKIK